MSEVQGVEIEFARKDECQPLTSEQIADIKAQTATRPRANVYIKPYEIYSPNEQEVGEWQQMVDGVLKKKLVYEKTINITTPSVSGTTFTLIENIDVLVDIDGYMKPSSGWRGRINTYQSQNSFTFFNYNENTHLFYFGTPASEYLSCEACLTLYYTKTTDSWEVV